MPTEVFPLDLAKMGQSEGVQIRAYSGRNMYGRECFGYRVERGISFMQPLVDILGTLVREENPSSPDEATFTERVRLVARLMDDMHTDQLGMGFIVYFPSFTLPTE